MDDIARDAAETGFCDNSDRADRAQAAIDAYASGAPRDESHFADLLCDLRHLADRDGIDFATQLIRAGNNYNAEKDED